MKDSGNTFFLLRHGQTDFNVRGLIAALIEESSDNPPHLNEVGENQARDAAESLANESIDFIYSSPFKRTVQTASIVSERVGIETKVDNRLREVEAGTLAGWTIADWEKYFEGKNTLTEGPPGGESLNDVRERAAEFLNDVNGGHNGKNILVVSHGDTLWMMQSILLGIEGEAILKTPYIENGEIKKFVVRAL